MFVFSIGANFVARAELTRRGRDDECKGLFRFLPAANETATEHLTCPAPTCEEFDMNKLVPTKTFNVSRRDFERYEIHARKSLAREFGAGITRGDTL